MNPLATFGKTPTGIPGLDEITGGGLPAGRSTLVCGFRIVSPMATYFGSFV